MSTKHVEYFDKLIQSKLEQFPRAVQGNVPYSRLIQICEELQILKDARDYFIE